MNKLCHLLLLGGAASALTACGSGSMEDISQVEQALACPKVTPNSLDVERSLWVRDAQILGKFSFQRVLTQIRTTSGLTLPSSNLDLFQRWMDTYNSDATGRFPEVTHCNDVPQEFGVMCPRPEGQFANLNTGGLPFKPVAIVNRFDLAPQTGANCGEYRIVFAKDQNLTPNGRMFIIFEAAMPNPSPGSGVAGCLPIANFWADLSKDTNLTSRQTKLENFYFNGTAIAGLEPVVHAKHYGLFNTGEQPGIGQIRTNNFINFTTWDLREFRTFSDGTRLSIQPQSNSDNPARHAFFDAPVAGRTLLDLNNFRNLFANTDMTASALLPNATNTIDLVSGISMAPSPRWNSIDSISQNSDMVYRIQAQTTMKTLISDRINELGLASTLSVDNVLDRATTQTCGGCHLQSDNVALTRDTSASGPRWPASLAFVHVNESGARSPALDNVFLPHRRKVLETYINGLCDQAALATVSRTAVTAPDPNKTVGGSAVGAAN